MSNSPDTLKPRSQTRCISEEEWQALLVDPQIAQQLFRGDDRRKDQRYRHDRVVRLAVSAGGSTRSTFLVRSNDLSTQGISFYHSQRMLPGVELELAMMNKVDRLVRIGGQVIASTVSESDQAVHFVRVKFHKAIRVTDFP